MRKIKKSEIWQFLRFCVVGTSNAVIDFGVLNLLLWLYPTSNTGKTLEYNSIAVLLASTNSFFWNKYWTFQQRSPITFQEIYRFIVLASGTTLMNDTLMWLLSRIFPSIISSGLLAANALKLGAIIGTMSISFFGMRLWVFFQRKYIGSGPTEVRWLVDQETNRLPVIPPIYNTALTKARWLVDQETIRLPTIQSVNDAETIILPKVFMPGKVRQESQTPFAEFPTQPILSDKRNELIDVL